MHTTHNKDKYFHDTAARNGGVVNIKWKTMPLNGFHKAFGDAAAEEDGDPPA